MSRKLSSISYAPMVEGVSRKFARRKDTCTMKEVGYGTAYRTIPGISYMGGSVRQANINGYGPVTKNVMFFRRPIKKHVPSADEVTARSNFAEVAVWLKTYYKNLSVLSANRAVYSECVADRSKHVKGVGAWGYETMRGWMFAVGQAYLAEGETLPQTALVIDA